MKKGYKPFTKKYSVKPVTGGFAVCYFGEVTGQVYSTDEQAREQVDKLYESDKKK